MTVLITLSGVGSSTGPTFDLYASPDGITFTQFATGINKTALEPGYQATVPDGTTDIKVTSLGQCTNSYVATIGVIPTTTTTTTTAAPVNSVEWLTGDYPPIAYGSSPGDIINLSGTLEIIGNPVTFRAYAFLLTGPGDGAVDTSIDIGNIDVGITSRYVDAVTPYDNGITQYSTSFTLPAGIYDWYVSCTFSNTASVGGEGGIDWVQA